MTVTVITVTGAMLLTEVFFCNCGFSYNHGREYGKIDGVGNLTDD